MTAPSNIARDERDDFFNGLASMGFKPEQFDLAATEQIPAGPGPVIATVFVTRKLPDTDLELHYAAGHGTDWVNKALDDLRRGQYGAP